MNASMRNALFALLLVSWILLGAGAAGRLGAEELELSFDGLGGEAQEAGGSSEILGVSLEGGSALVASAANPLADLDAGAIDEETPFLHSWCVIDIESGGVRGSARAGSRPRCSATLERLAVVNAALAEVAAGRLTVDSRAVIEHENVDAGNGQGWRPGRVMTIRTAAHDTIRWQVETAANLLAVRLGGLSRVNELIAALGYGSTRFDYLKPKRRTESAADAGTTARDMALVLRDFWLRYQLLAGKSHVSPWDAFRSATDRIQMGGRQREMGGVVGKTALASGSAGVFRIDGRLYGIVVFTEKDGRGGKANARYYLEEGTAAVARAIRRSARSDA